jgi:hypothetical protein
VDAKAVAHRVKETTNRQFGGRAVLADPAEAGGGSGVNDEFGWDGLCAFFRVARARHESDDRTHRFAPHPGEVGADRIEEARREAELGDFSAREKACRRFLR